MMRILAAGLCLIGWVTMATAQQDDRFDRLYDVLEMDDVLTIMRDEGVAYGADLRAEMFPGRTAEGWLAKVDRIYDHARMTQVMRNALAQEMQGADLDPLIAYFASDVGKRVVQLEISARRAMLDEDIEEAAYIALADRDAAGDSRLALLERFVTVNDLLESNVVGALNSNFEFYLGMLEGGGFPYDVSEDEMLADIWSQEPEIRIETEDWLYAYLLMAYDPLDDATLDGYIALAESAPGQRLNRALFTAFDVLFRGVSRELGRAASQMMQGEDI